MPDEAEKNEKKSAKKFGGKEKSSTFAIPFGKRDCEWGRDEGFPGGRKKIIDRLWRQDRSTENKESRASIPSAGRSREAAWGAWNARSAKRDRIYTKKSLILAQDER